MKVKRMSSKGFSLVEVMVAAVLVVIVVMGIAVVIPSNTRQVTNTANISEATALAQKYLESIKNQWTSGSFYNNNTNVTGYGAFNPANGVVDDRVHTQALHPGQIFYYNSKYVFYVQVWDPKNPPNAPPAGGTLPGTTPSKRIRVTFYLGNGNAGTPAIRTGATTPLASIATDIASP